MCRPYVGHVCVCASVCVCVKTEMIHFQSEINGETSRVYLMSEPISVQIT